MGNKRRALLERKSRDPRTKKRKSNRYKKQQQHVNDSIGEESIVEQGTSHEDVGEENLLLNADEVDLKETQTVAAEENGVASTIEVELESSSSTDAVNVCTSEKKINTKSDIFDDDEFEVDDDVDSGYLFVDIGVLFPVFNQLVKCPRCDYHVETKLSITGRQGLANLIEISCRSLSCRWKHMFYTSKLVAGETSRGPKPFDVNIRSQIAFHEIGRGHEAIKTFCGYMNMPPPSNKSGFNNITNKLFPVYEQVMKENLKKAADEIREANNDDTGVLECDIGNDGLVNSSESVAFDSTTESDDEITDTAISVDGSWQRRGYASLNGLVIAIAIDSGKCLSYETLVNKCKSCQMWESKKVGERITFEEHQKTHTFAINYSGSAASMETEGAKKIFLKSVKELKLGFTTYIGDGDSKAYPAVAGLEPYGPEKPVIKGECIGHVQKRVGTRFRRFKKDNSNKICKDNKKIGGVGRLTDKTINRLLNYYGIAIRQNIHDLAKMRRAVGAVIYHCSEASDSKVRHMFCDPSAVELLKKGYS